MILTTYKSVAHPPLRVCDTFVGVLDCGWLRG